MVLEKVKANNKNNSKISINGLILKNGSIAPNHYLDDSNLREFEFKLPTSNLIISKKNYKYPIEVIFNLK